MPLFNLSDLARDLDVPTKETISITGFSIDSRKVNPGDLFFALPGDKVDGHLFLKEAKERGARAAVVQNQYKGDPFGLVTLPVSNVLESLQMLATRQIERRKSKIVGITGSIGKTTTKEFTAHLLSSTYRVDKTPLSYNSQASLPLSILNSSPDAEVLVLEMGMSEPGELKRLVSIAPPDIAVITTVALQHAIAFPEGIDSIAREKGEIFSCGKTTLGILHHDINLFQELKQKGSFKKVSFSCSNKEADYFLEEKEGGIRIFSKDEGTIDFAFTLPLFAHYQNFLSAFLVARALNVPLETIAELIPTLKLPPMRFEQVKKKGVTFINDAYNANPDAMKAALQALQRFPTFGKRIAVLSEMNALGPFSDATHLEMGEVSIRSADILLCIGSRCAPMESVWRRGRKICLRFPDKLLLTEALRMIANEGDVVLLKGARAWALEEVLEKF